MRGRTLLFGTMLAGGTLVAVNEATDGKLFCQATNDCPTTEISPGAVSVGAVVSPPTTTLPKTVNEHATFQEVKDYWVQRGYDISQYGMVIVREGVTTVCYENPIDHLTATHIIAMNCGSHFFMVDFLETGHANQSNIDDFNTLTIAHESGHAVQNQAYFDHGIELPSINDSEFEQQADCLAGNFYGGTNRNIDGAVKVYQYLGQISGNNNSHGSTEERITAFTRGTTGEDCF